MVRQVKISFFVLALGLLAFSRLSYADWSVSVGVGPDHHDHWDRGHYGWHDHPHWGYHEHFLPADCSVILVGGARYSYCGGLYYAYAGVGDYVLVDPPVGAYVAAIPPDFQAVNINGVTYYTSEGVYYVLTHHHGFKVVSAPVVYTQPQVVIAQSAPVVVAQPAPVVVEQDSFPVNVPNNSGGYTSVIIKKSGTGYVGPQGEFYATFPSVSQLKAMYGK